MTRIVQVLKHPTAFLPIVMSSVALAAVVFHLARFGTAPQPDKGAAARVWQLMMAGQAPIIAFFAARWLPQYPRQALVVVTLQVGAALAAMAPVFLLGW